MLKKNFYFIILSIFCLGTITSFAQMPKGKTNIVIDDMLANGGGCNPYCSQGAPGSNLVSSKVVYQGGLSYFLSAKKVMPLTYLQNNRISYRVEVIPGCLNGENLNGSQCYYSFNVDFFHSSCSIGSGASYAVKVGYTQSSQVIKNKNGNDYSILSSAECNTLWNININLSMNGVVLESPDPFCQPIIKVTEEEWVCTTSNPNDQLGNGRMQSSPNPTTGLVDIRFEGISEGAANIQIYNNVGSIIQEISSVPTTTGQNTTQIDLSYLPVGLYNIAIRQGATVLTQRIQKL